MRTIPTRNAGLRRFAPVSESATTAPDERADADRRVEVADASVAEIEELDRDDDDEDLNRTDDDRLGREEHDEHAKRRVLPSAREAGEALRAIVDASSSRRGVGSRALDEEQEQRRNDDEPAVTAKTTPVLATASSNPASAGPAKTATLSIRSRPRSRPSAPSGVRASDGVSAAWDERKGSSRSWRDRQRRRRPADRVGEYADRRCADENDPGDVRDEEDPLPRIAVAEHSRERRHERSWDEACEEDEADGLLSPDPVGVHRDGDEERALADDRRRPRELEPAEIPRFARRLERGERVREAASRCLPTARSISPDAC